MKSPKTLYILIFVFCIFALIGGIYAQFIENGTGSNKNVIKESGSVNEEKDAETIKSEFDDLFTNTINLNGVDTTGIVRMNPNEEIVYSAYDIDRTELAYDLDINIPLVNINTEVAKSFNQNTQAIFANKANEILKKTDETSQTIYSIDYVAFVNNDILSIAIKSTLKEGQNAQRVMVQTYNYNLATGMQVSLNDLITIKSLNKSDVEEKIKSVVQEADNAAKAIQGMGYEDIFSRDLSSDIYTVDNSKTFLLGNDNRLYIIYPYGNNNFTSEMDIVLL